jgi:hypothetical protein
VTPEFWLCILALIGVAYGLLAVNARIERAERQQQRQQLLDRLYRTDKVTRW